VFISSVRENNSKDAAKRKMSNFVTRKWPQHYLIYVQHKQFHQLSITCNIYCVLDIKKLQFPTQKPAAFSLSLVTELLSPETAER
jgi:hypothetical protein